MSAGTEADDRGRHFSRGERQLATLDVMQEEVPASATASGNPMFGG